MSARPRRVRTARPRTAGWGGSLWEEIQWPRWVYYPARGAWQVVKRYPRSSAVLAVLAVLWSNTSLVTVLVVCGVGVAAGLTWRLAWGRRAEGAAGSSVVSPWELKQRRDLRKKWAVACERGKLLDQQSGEPPKLKGLRSDGHGTFVATVSAPDSGVALVDLTKKLEHLTDWMGLHEIVLDPRGRGVAGVSFHTSDAIGRVLPLADLPIAPEGQIAYGIRQDGSAATVLTTQSVFIAGETGSGKSVCVWALLADCIRQGLPVDLYVCDPKGGMEMDALERAMRAYQAAENRAGAEAFQRPLVKVRAYVKTPGETVTMLQAAEKAMQARQYEAKKSGVKKIRPDWKNPLVVVLIDELLPLAAMLQKGSDSPLGRILYLGRAVAYVVWGASQLSQKDTMGPVRDLFPQRICFGTPNPSVTDTALGQYAESLGAKCSEVKEPGIGWSHAEGTKRPRKFRCAEVTDRQAELVAAGRLPANVANKATEAYDRRAEDQTNAGRARKERRRALYRWYYIDDPEYGNSLGYVGTAFDVLRRESEHSAALRAFVDGNVRRTVTWFDTADEANEAERIAIQTEHPIHNVIHNGGDRLRLLGRRRDRVA